MLIISPTTLMGTCWVFKLNKIIYKRNKIYVLQFNNEHFHNLTPEAQMDSAINIVCYGVTTCYLLTHNPLATSEGLLLFIIYPETELRLAIRNCTLFLLVEGPRSSFTRLDLWFMLLITFYTREMNIANEKCNSLLYITWLRNYFCFG
jgi:hypothetical protein